MSPQPPDPPSPPPAGSPAGVELRPATEDDRAFLLEVYATTRADELAVLPWTDVEKASFVAMQFDVQDRAYRQAWPDAEFLVILRAGVPVGRLYLASIPGELIVVDIALLPGHRGQGIGSGLLTEVLARADRDGHRVTLHVEPWNPARRLYERLGFEVREVRGFYASMVRPAVS